MRPREVEGLTGVDDEAETEGMGVAGPPVRARVAGAGVSLAEVVVEAVFSAVVAADGVLLGGIVYDDE